MRTDFPRRKINVTQSLSYEKLTKENSMLVRIISQIQNLLLNCQTKSLCSLGHHWCKIDHVKYNYVKQAGFDQHHKKHPKCDSQKTNIHLKENAFKVECKDAKNLVKLNRKIDDLQSKYGLPTPLLRNNTAGDLMCSEFATLWDNVLCFGFKIVETYKEDSDSIQVKQKSSKQKHNRSNIILKSRPLKFTSNKTSKKSLTSYFPMTDVELAIALNMEEKTFI